MNEEEPLLQLLRLLKARRYSFTTVTPATHARVLARPWDGRADLCDIFGWSRPFPAEALDEGIVGLLEQANALEDGGEMRSKVRVASLDGELFLHSAYPTDSPDAVFFGPDTYRFAAFVRQHLDLLRPCDHIVDMGAGSGAAGILVAKWLSPQRVSLVDSNPAALLMAGVNAAAVGVTVELVESDAVPSADALIANPPYIMDPARRAYRDGGDLFGGAVALEWVKQGLQKLSPGGIFVLYTGAAYVAGEAPLMSAIEAACLEVGASLTWHEIDPDVFGEELAEPAYRHVERIAALGAIITASDATAVAEA